MIYAWLYFYSIIHGLTNAILYSRKGAEALEGNEHRYLVAERAVAYSIPAPAILYTALFGPWLALLLVAGELLAAGLAFSYVHNRSYYLNRDRIDRTRNGSRHTSTSSTAKNTMTYQKRRGLWRWSWVVLLFLYGLCYIVKYI